MEQQLLKDWKPDGTKFFITDRGSPARVVEYSVSNAWDVTTGTITEGTNFSVSSYETCYDVAFNSLNKNVCYWAKW